MATQLVERPRTKFTPEIVDELLARTARGEPLVSICELSHMPSRETVYDWLEENHSRFWAEFETRFRAARARGVHALAEQCVEIADNATGDVYIDHDKDGNPVAKVDGDVVQRAKLKIDTRLRLAGKWLPKVYGDKLDLTSGGEKIAAPASDEALALEIFKIINTGAQPAIEGEFTEVPDNGSDLA